MHFSGYRHKYPFIRLVIPLVAGIFVCEQFADSQKWMWSVGSGALLLSALFVLLSRIVGSYSTRWLWGTGIMLFLFSLGIFNTVFQRQKTTLDVPEGKVLYVASISGDPQEKAKSIRCPVAVEAYRDSTGIRCCDYKLLLYFSKDSLARKLCWGDRLMFYSRLDPPRNGGNPEEFDYARYLFHQGIGGTTFVPSGSWKQLPSPGSPDLRQRANSWKEKMLDCYRRMGIKGDELAVLSALTVGDKDELSEEIRHAYSVAGVSHVLALSGLHIGLIYVLLGFLLSWADKNKLLRLAKILFLILCLWAFAFMTGLSASVVRSVSMFSLVALATLFRNRPATLNTLAVAAFFMLLYNPFYLFDVSFQLSFISVAGIVIIQPWLFRKVKIENRLLRYVWGMATVTIAAQIVTAPLVMHYFSSFPVHFLWANLLIILLITLILYLSILMLLVGFFPVVQSFVAMILNYLLRFQNHFTSFIEQLPASSVDNIDFKQVYVFGFYFSILMFGFYLINRKRKILVALMACMLFLVVFHLREKVTDEIRPSILFYNNRTSPCVHFICSKDESYLLAAEGDSMPINLKQIAGRFWISHQISEPLVLRQEFENDKISNHQHLILFSGKKVCLVNDDRWLNKVANAPLFVDYLYICNGFKGRIGPLTGLFKARKVVLDSSLPAYRLAFLKQECRELGLDFISISEKGSYCIEV